MIRILVLNPVATEVWNKLTYNCLTKIASPETEIVVRNIKEGPKVIESNYDRDYAAHYVVNEVIKADKEGFNAIIINCFDDPGLYAAREVSNTLILGIGETSINIALLLGFRIAIISTGSNAKLLYYRRAVELGIDKRVVYTGGIDIGVLELRKDEEKVMELLLNEGRKAVDEYGADVIVLGCGGFIGMAEKLSKKLNVPVIDPSEVTFKIAESLARIGIKHSRKHLFNRLNQGYP
mgnify:CR=1 FL=1